MTYGQKMWIVVGVIVILVSLLCFSEYIDIKNDSIVITKNIIVTGKICGDYIDNIDRSEIQDENGVVYATNYSECFHKYQIGSNRVIQYNHIGTSILAAKDYSYNRIVNEM